MVYTHVWRVQVGTVPLYLLDTNIEPNNQFDRDITDAFYREDFDTCIHQEIMLGTGGFRALEALAHKPSFYQSSLYLNQQPRFVKISREHCTNQPN